MSTTNPDPRLDRLYQLLPVIHRMRDADQQYALRGLLQVIAEQVNVVEDDIAQLYENFFIGTADDWVVPYLGDLIGYRPVAKAGPAGDDATLESRALNRVLIPRREVANTLRYRRRKGSLALLELLARDVADWPARAVEFYRLLGWNQNLNHQHPHRARTADLRRMDDLDLLNGPFDRLAHTVEVRRIDSHRRRGRWNIPSVGVFAWRLKSFSVTGTPACCVEKAGSGRYTFSVLGNDAPLFINPRPEPCPTHIAQELNVPATIRRLAFAHHTADYYGAGKSLAIYVDGWGDYDSDTPIPASAIVPADLTDWHYVPVGNTVAVDPVLGRFAFPPENPPRKTVRVNYHYGFSAPIGSGEYARPVLNPSPRPNAEDAAGPPTEPVFYRVGQGQLERLNDALDQWQQENPADAVIEICDSGVYSEQIEITLPADHTLQIRAANRVRPVIRLIDWQTDRSDAFAVTMAPGSRLTLDGLLITGRPLQITGPSPEAAQARAPICGSRIVIRHCTLVPGWSLDCDCQPNQDAEPSIELFEVRARLRIEHSIVGSIQVHENEVSTDPLPVCISDSILDGTSPDREALGAAAVGPKRDRSGAAQPTVAHALLTIRRCTVFGIINVHAIELAENCIFTNCLNVARRQLGCMRFCSVPSGCRTPRRYHCQPDLVIQAVKEAVADPAERERLAANEELRVEPQFTSVRYGHPGYAQLGCHCAEEIKRGADDDSEMGVFHDLFQPQREANLIARLEEFTPAGMDVGLLFVT